METEREPQQDYQIGKDLGERTDEPLESTLLSRDTKEVITAGAGLYIVKDNLCGRRYRQGV